MIYFLNLTKNYSLNSISRLLPNFPGFVTSNIITRLPNYIYTQRRMETTAQEVKTIEEGKAKVQTLGNVFYNPVQEFNRDLSIAVLRTFIKDFTLLPQKNKHKKEIPSIGKNGEPTISNEEKPNVSILEALSATGLRSIRYAKEIPGVTRIVANDLSAPAVQSIKENIELNGVQNVVETSHEDAMLLMYQHRRPWERFSAVDLDPYGCPSTFLDAAVQCTQDGGLLLVTATDMAVLAGNSPETCYSKYGAVSLRWKACHEQALRILLQCIESHANRYGRYIVPLLSISADFYIRVFVKILTSPLQCKKTTSKLSIVYQCVGCETFTLQPLGAFKPNPSSGDPQRSKAVLPHAPSVPPHCPHCQQKHHMGGPVWTGPLHDLGFVGSVLQLVQEEPDSFGTAKRMEGVLSMLREELPDVPFYYTMEKLCATLHIETIPMLIMRSAILNGGYRVSYSHACKTSIKTDAPPSFVWDILREWEKEHPVKKNRLEEDCVAKNILSQEMSSKVDLSERSDANPLSRRDGRLRFQDNPAPFWGPGTRATARVGDEKITKSRRNQNKKSKMREQVTKRERSPTSPDERKIAKNSPNCEMDPIIE